MEWLACKHSGPASSPCQSPGVLRAFACVALACVGLTGCDQGDGDEQTAAGDGGLAEFDRPRERPKAFSPRTLSAEWNPAYRGRYPVAVDRSRSSVSIEVSAGTCFPYRADLAGRARRRLRKVQVRETSQAVFIRVLLREERPPEGPLCAGVGTGFNYRVRLERPLGDRAVIDLEHHYDPSEPIVYPASDREMQRELVERFHRHPLKPRYEPG